MTAKQGVLFCTVVALLMDSGCAEHYTGPIHSYIDAKNSYASAIEQKSDLFSPNYRLVPIPPFVEPYEPGTQLLKSNRRLITRSCSPLRLEERALPDVPDMLDMTTFNFSTDASQVLKMVATGEFSAALERNALATLKFRDIKSRIASLEDLLAAAKGKQCRAILRRFIGEEVITIDGIVTAKELIRSKGATILKVDASQQQIGEFTVRYSKTGGYELVNTTAQPKFWIISEGKIGSRIPTPAVGDFYAFRPEHDSEAESDEVEVYITLIPVSNETVEKMKTVPSRSNFDH